MRILILQDQLRVGGTERQTLHLARYFVDQGETVQLLVFEPGGELYASAQASGIPMRVLQPFASGIALWAPGLCRAVADFAPEVILAMGRTANCFAGWLQEQFTSAPVVSTLRTGKTLFPLHSWSLNHVRGVLVNSNWWKRRLLERGHPNERIQVVHNSVLLERSPEEARNTRADVRRRMGVDSETVVFLNVASFRRGKRHADLLEIVASFRQRYPSDKWQLWLVGNGRERARCIRLANMAGLAGKVRFLGYQRDTAPFYMAADVAVSTSREDSLPNFLIEAQAAGLPLIAYECRGVAECCVPGRTGFVPRAGDAETFLTLMHQLSTDHASRKRIAQPAMDLARERFSPERNAARVLEFLYRLRNPRPDDAIHAPY